MAENSKIEWTDHTFNPWIGCQKVSPGCDNCYAEALMDKRYGKVQWGPHGERKRTGSANWKLPLRWAKAARAADRRPRVFCASLADVFDNRVPPEWRYDLFDLIKATPELDWLLLTKRPENIAKMAGPGLTMLPNVWIGFTAEDQKHFDSRWAIVKHVPANVRFCSYEPALGSLRLLGDVQGLHWLICGGESGHAHREMEPTWETDVRHDCQQIGIAYFFKQMPGKRPIPPGMKIVRQFPKAVA